MFGFFVYLMKQTCIYLTRRPDLFVNDSAYFTRLHLPDQEQVDWILKQMQDTIRIFLNFIRFLAPVFSLLSGWGVMYSILFNIETRKMFNQKNIIILYINAEDVHNQLNTN